MSKAVGIRELKAHLSRYVREVKDGEEILVSDRGRVIARIVPIDPHSEAARLRNMLLKLSTEAKIVLPRVHVKPAPPAWRKKVKGSPFSDAVLEDRR